MGGVLIEQTKVIVNKLHPDAKLPTYGSDEAAGADLSAVVEGEAVAIPVGERVLIKTGLSLEILPGFEGQVRPRSGLALKQGITVLNTPGTIDSDYRGEVGVILYNAGNRTYYVNNGDRIAQLVISPIVQGIFVEGEVNDTNRGEGGFGSTGVSA